MGLPTCTACGQAVGADKRPLTTCSACKAPYHAECWASRDRCAVERCDGRARRRGFPGSVVEALIVIVILAITVSVAVSFYRPDPAARRATAEAQLDQIRMLIEAYNAVNSDREYTDADLAKLPGLDAKYRLDPWGNPYINNFAGGYVFSYGESGTSSDEKRRIKSYYKPPCAELVSVVPESDTKVSDKRPKIESTWHLVNADRIERVVATLDRQPIQTRMEPGQHAGVFRVIAEPAADLEHGNHEIEVTVTDNRGNASRRAWKFRMEGEGR